MPIPTPIIFENAEYENENNVFSWNQVLSPADVFQVLKLPSCCEGLCVQACVILHQATSTHTLWPIFAESHTSLLSWHPCWGWFLPKVTYYYQNIFLSIINMSRTGLTHQRENFEVFQEISNFLAKPLGNPKDRSLEPNPHLKLQ